MGLNQSNALEALTDRQLAELLYRDHLVLKHSSSKYIQDAVNLCESQSQKQKAETAKGSGSEAMIVRALIDFMIEADVDDDDGYIQSFNHSSTQLNITFKLDLG